MNIGPQMGGFVEKNLNKDILMGAEEDSNNPVEVILVILLT